MGHRAHFTAKLFGIVIVNLGNGDSDHLERSPLLSLEAIVGESLCAAAFSVQSRRGQVYHCDATNTKDMGDNLLVACCSTFRNIEINRRD